MVVIVGTDKHCAASRKALQIESATSEIQCVKNTCAENFAITNKSINERRFAAMSLLQVNLSVNKAKKDYAAKKVL